MVRDGGTPGLAFAPILPLQGQAAPVFGEGGTSSGPENRLLVLTECVWTRMVVEPLLAVVWERFAVGNNAGHLISPPWEKRNRGGQGSYRWVVSSLLRLAGALQGSPRGIPGSAFLGSSCTRRICRAPPGRMPSALTPPCRDVGTRVSPGVLLAM